MSFNPLSALASIAGGIGGFFVGGPLGAAIGSGLGTTLATGDVGQGIVSGLLGYGLGGLGSTLGEFGTEAAKEAAKNAVATGATGAATGAAGAGSGIASGLSGAAAGAAPGLAGEELIGAGAAPLNAAVNAGKDWSAIAANIPNNITNPQAWGSVLHNNPTALATLATGGLGAFMNGGGGGYQSPNDQYPPQIPTSPPYRRYNPTAPSPTGGENIYFSYAGGGPVSGPGGGLDDAIPAIVNGRQPANLSSGEYVVPAHAVSALGDGSTEAGVRQLDGMVNHVMMGKYGTRHPVPMKGAGRGHPFMRMAVQSGRR